MDLLLGKPAIAAKLEDRFGGRVCPMTLGDAAGVRAEAVAWEPDATDIL